jgi:hypothetical protein
MGNEQPETALQQLELWKKTTQTTANAVHISLRKEKLFHICDITGFSNQTKANYYIAKGNYCTIERKKN